MCRRAGWLVAGWLSLGLLVSSLAARAEDRHETMSWAGRERSYRLHVPPAAPGAMPLVLALHGAGNNADGFAGETQFAKAADARHMLIVFPDGTGSEDEKLTWNAHFCCGAAIRDKSDDIGFIVALIAHIAAELPVDHSRIYATGMSNGAMFAYQLAAARPDLIAAIAPVAGTIGGTSRDGDPFVIAPPSLPVAVMIIHGRKDPFVLFDGGTSKLLGYPKRSNMAVAAALEFWSKVDGCEPEPERSEPEPGILRHLAFAGCRAGSDVQLWELEEGDHSWPPPDITFPAPDGGKRTAAEEILAFFMAHPRSEQP